MVYLAAGFIAVWLIITLYVVYMGLRQRKLEQELQNIEELLQEQRKA
jgi:CcmD family protein